MANRMALPLLVLGALCALVLGGCRQANVPEAYVNPDFRAHIPQRVAVYVSVYPDADDGEQDLLTATTTLKIHQQIRDALHRMNPRSEMIMLSQDAVGPTIGYITHSLVTSDAAAQRKLTTLCTNLEIDAILYFGIEAETADGKDDAYHTIRFHTLLMQKDAGILWSNDYILKQDDLRDTTISHPERLAPALAKELLQTLPAGK